MARPKKEESEVSQDQQRIFKNQQEVDHDLFKLKPATMKKNQSWNNTPKIEELEHCHMFHTVDSYGTPQQFASRIGGHTHEVTVINNGPGMAPTVKVGPAVQLVTKKVRGKKKKVYESVVVYRDKDNPEDFEIDSHTHEAEYRSSEKITLRQPNVEFAKFETALAQKQNPVVENVVIGKAE